MKIYRDPENIGWAACVEINPDDMTILLVRNLKRESQINRELLKQGFETEEDQRRHKRRIIWELSQKRLLEKPSKWELLGGKISYWQGNPALRKEFNSLVLEEAQKEFEEKIGERVLFDNELLARAAESTAESEYVEEGGKIIKEKLFLTRVNDPDRTDPKNPNLFYPRFWYLVNVASGTLRTEPIKDSISEPRWIPLLQLHPYLSKENSFPFHPSHCLGVVAAAKYFIRNGRPEFAEVVSYLEKTFGAQKEAETFEDCSDWESFAKTVKPLEK